jgi:hypothetical protein
MLNVLKIQFDSLQAFLFVRGSLTIINLVNFILSLSIKVLSMYNKYRQHTHN